MQALSATNMLTMPTMLPSQRVFNGGDLAVS